MDSRQDTLHLDEQYLTIFFNGAETKNSLLQTVQVVTTLSLSCIAHAHSREQQVLLRFLFFAVKGFPQAGHFTS